MEKNIERIDDDKGHHGYLLKIRHENRRRCFWFGDRTYGSKGRALKAARIIKGGILALLNRTPEAAE